MRLLIKEAQLMGVVVNPDDVETVLRNDLPPSVANSDHADDYRLAIADALRVRQAFLRASSVIKVSTPMRQHDLATLLQQISVNLVEFDAAKFKDKVPAPTPEQLKEQYEKYRETLPGNSGSGNPFGFGYKYPDRVKLQYIEVRRSEVRRAVQTAKTEHRWEVDSYKYYLLHQDQFATTQPAATQPTGGNSMSLDTPAKGPTTRPFPQVADQVKQHLIEQETTKLEMQVFEKISAALGGDYMSYSGAVPQGATQPTTMPLSSVRVPYNTFDYLKALAAQIQSTDGVLPVVTSVNDHFVSPAEAMKLPGIGQAKVEQEDLASYLERSVTEFNPNNQNGNGTLALWQPSSALKDDLDDLFVLRVTDAQAAHVPASLAEVQDQVRQDWIKKQAYDMAHASAEKVLNEAKVDGLRSAAQQDGLKIITTGGFMNKSNADIPGYHLPPAAKQPFIDGCFELLSTPRPQPGALPLRVVEMPQAGLADTAELISVTPIFKPQDEQIAMAEADHYAMQRQLRPFGQDWFDYDSVVSRLQYRPEQPSNTNQQPQGPSPAQQPIF